MIEQGTALVLPLPLQITVNRDLVEDSGIARFDVNLEDMLLVGLEVPAPPVIGPLPPRLIEKRIPWVGLLTHLLLRKYVDHLPLYRQEQIFRERYEVKLPRPSMLDWVHQVAQWLKTIYNYMRGQLLEGGSLQADETPIRYLDSDVGKKGSSRRGYLWVCGRPGGEGLFD